MGSPRGKNVTSDDSQKKDSRCAEASKKGLKAVLTLCKQTGYSEMEETSFTSIVPQVANTQVLFGTLPSESVGYKPTWCLGRIGS